MAECTWATYILIPKGGGEYHGIGLVEVIWKAIAIRIDQRLVDYIEFHYILHRFIAWRGTGTTNLDTKKLQQIAVLWQEVL